MKQEIWQYILLSFRDPKLLSRYRDKARTRATYLFQMMAADWEYVWILSLIFNNV